MRLVERHIVKDNRFEDICFKSGLLYNYVLYNIRQGIFSGNYLKEFDLSNKLCKENQFDFRNLPNHVSQQVIKQVFKNIKSWIKLKKDFEKNPSKYGNHRPHLPSYKQGKKQNMVVFTNCNCRVKGDNCIYFVKDIIKPIKTNVKKDELKQRGLFQSSVGKLINADINGAIGIARKVVGDSFIGKIIDSGFVFNPVRINIL